MYELRLGIEHLMTGVELVSDSGQNFRFEYDSPSIMRVTSLQPFRALWYSRGTDGDRITLNATAADNDCLMQFSLEEINWFAGPVSEAMRKVGE